MFEVSTFLLVNLVTAFGDIVFTELGSERRGGVSIPLIQQNSKPVPLHSDFLPRGCSNEEDFCEFDTNYPDISTIKNIVRANSSELELKLLFTNQVLSPSLYTAPENAGSNQQNTFSTSSYTTATKQEQEATNSGRAGQDPTS